MRELILKMSISLDGFVAGPRGEIAWMFGDDQEAKAWSVDVVGTAGVHIMGSRTFRDMAACWPMSDDLFAPAMNRIPKTVFSRRGASILDGVSPAAAQAGAESWAQTEVASGDLAEDIAALKAKSGAPIIAHGGARFARSLVARGLVDRFVLLVHPVALGEGLPLFSELATPLRLELVSARGFVGGAVAKIYRAT